MDKLKTIIENLPALTQISLQEWAWLSWWVMKIILALMVARAFNVLILRIFGLYHPAFYFYCPRLPWRPFYNVAMTIWHWWERVFSMGKKSSGNFASTLAVLALLYRPGQLLVGRAYGFGMPLFQSVGLSLAKHCFILASTGSGKTTALISMLSAWKNSVFLIDPTGLVTRVLAASDRRTWHVIDPNHMTGFQSASFNAFDCMSAAVKRDNDENACVLWASRIAYALIVTPESARVPYFYEVVRAFLTGLILHVRSEHPESEHNLPYVRKLIVEGYRVVNDDGQEETKGNEAYELLLRDMAQNTAYDGAISGAVAAMKTAGGETGGNLWSTLQDQTRFLDLPAVAAVLKKTSLPLSELKTRNDVVLSFVAPVSSIKEELSLYVVKGIWTDLDFELETH